MLKIDIPDEALGRNASYKHRQNFFKKFFGFIFKKFLNKILNKKF